MVVKEINFNPKILINYFDILVREQCRSCKRFGYKNTCPPFIPEIDYFKKLLPKYKYGKIIIMKFKIDSPENWKQLGENSSLELHNLLLKYRNNLIDKGFVFSIALTAGSCKLCSRCSHPCLHPEKALIPVEGSGINLIKLMNHFKIKVLFPIKNNFLRIGILLWK